ncbi:MAG: DUF2974 domain-containing protein [Lachnospira sp.]|nr:DUF2974 domain-containing protein [Lachnospira sp.]
MANIRDYIAWRGDLTFKQAPFCDVDNLIISELAYVDLKGIVPSAASGENISLKDAARLFFEIHTMKELEESLSFVKEAPFMFKEMAECNRFAEVQLCNYVDVTDEKTQMQFAAFHVKLGDGTVYVVYRGTDDSLIGWKEDFNMSFISPVPSQLAAVEFLNNTVRVGSGKIRVGGHSKGGNLAIYASVHCSARVKKKIIEVYNNDGPGFDKSIIISEAYQNMLPRIKTIVPYHSVVGMLLEHEEDYMVVASSQKGFMQHDPMSWEVIGCAFVAADSVSRASKVLSDVVSNWIAGLDKKKREEFVEALFAIINASGAKTLTDLRMDILNSAGAALKLYATMDKESRKMIANVLQMFTGEFDKVLKLNQTGD